MFWNKDGFEKDWNPRHDNTVIWTVFCLKKLLFTIYTYTYLGHNRKIQNDTIKMQRKGC